MFNINDVMDDFETETKTILVNGEPRTIKEVLDSILKKDEEKKKQFSEG